MTIINDITQGIETSKTRLAFLVDNDLQAEMVLVRMQKRGFHTSIHHNILSLANEATRHTAPDIIVVDADVFAPYIIDQIKKNEHGPQPKIFIISRHHNNKKQAIAKRFKADAFIRKPLNPSVLNQTINQCLNTWHISPKHILIIEEEYNTIKRCHQTLEKLGMRARFAKNAAEATKEIKNQKPDLVLMNYTMPGTKDDNIIESIRKLYNNAELPVIMMSRTKNPDILSKIQSFSAYPVLQKPLKDHEILTTIEAALNTNN